MVSYLFATDDLVDVQAQQGVWRIARIKQVDHSQGYYVSYVGFHEDRDMWVSPLYCEPFRTMTRGCTWSPEEMEILPYEVNEETLDIGKQFIDWLSSGSKDMPAPKVLVDKYRGDLFFLVHTILESKPQSLSAAKVRYTLLEEYLGLMCWWLDFAQKKPQALLRTINNPASIYESTDQALVSMHPELLRIFTDVFLEPNAPFFQVKDT